MFDRRAVLFGLVAAPCVAVPALADQPWFFSRQAAVIGGYDVVSYFRDGRPLRGSWRNAVMWKGSTWQFASAEHRSLFEMNPKAYAPQYGGYCAYAVSRGYTASVEPEAWQIVDGKLYLCNSLSVRARWQNDIAGHIQRGDANWPHVLSG